MCGLADAGCILGRFPHQTGGGLLGPLTDLRAGLTRGRQHPRGLLAEEGSDGLLVETPGAGQTAGLHGLQFALEEPLPLLQPAELGRHHPQEVADLLLVEAPARRGERR